MTDPRQPTLLDHEVDGIKELDNLLPRWWVWLMWITVGFSVVYIGIYHVFRTAPLSVAIYEKEMALALGAAEAAPADTAPPEPSTEPDVLARGQQLFAQCVPCHGPQGQGVIGPNLCDDYWIHGPAFADNLRTIREGVPAKGMITWKNVLSPYDIKAVASYIFTLRGSNPPNPKAPEGQRAEQAAAKEG
jgi:cytochrome c oxidase cbb3-type subunit III